MGRDSRPAGASGSTRVTLFHAEACSLCERARAKLVRLRDELGFELEEVDIGGDSGLEARYREWLPVVELEGVRAFVYFVDEAAFRRKLGADGAQSPARSQGL